MVDIYESLKESKICAYWRKKKDFGKRYFRILDWNIGTSKKQLYLEKKKIVSFCSIKWNRQFQLESNHLKKEKSSFLLKLAYIGKFSNYMRAILKYFEIYTRGRFTNHKRQCFSILYSYIVYTKYTFIGIFRAIFHFSIYSHNFYIIRTHC